MVPCFLGEATSLTNNPSKVPNQKIDIFERHFQIFITKGYKIILDPSITIAPQLICRNQHQFDSQA